MFPDRKACFIMQPLLIGKRSTGPSPVSASATVKVDIDKGRAAFLLMNTVQMRIVPDEFLDAMTTSSFLHEKAVIKIVHRCKGFARYFSDTRALPSSFQLLLMNLPTDKQTVSLSLTGGVSLPGGGVGVNAKSAWQLDEGSGDLRFGCHDSYVFTPLYEIQAITSPGDKRRGAEPDDRQGVW